MAIFNSATRLMTILSLMALSAALGCEKKPRPLSRQERQDLGPTAGPAMRSQIQVPKDLHQAKNDDLLPAQRQVTCAESYCPPQVGALVFIDQQANKGRRPVHRCTAALVAPDLVLSNGHCDMTSRGPGYFLTQDGQLSRVSQVFYKVFTASNEVSPDPEAIASGRPDAALYRLEQPLVNITPLKIAQGPQMEFNQLTAYVVNLGAKGRGYLIQAITCPIRRNEALWPYDLKENPDVIMGFGCQTQAGNSGAPMFAPGSDEIQAVYLGFGDPERQRKATLLSYQRRLFNFEDHWTMMATNVRCLNFPGTKPLTCTEATLNETSDRFQNQQNAARANLKSLRPTDADRYPFEFSARVFALKYDSKSADRAYEIIYEPKCRKTASIAQLIFPQEHILVGFNEWGEIKQQVIARSESVGRVDQQSPASVGVSMNWQPGFGPLLTTEKMPDPESLHPRKRYGLRFSIDLPQCAR